MSALIPFQFDGREVRVITDGNGEPWFIAKEVAEVLGYSDAEAMTRRLDDDEKQNLRIVGFGPRGVTAMNESGLYSAILGSSKPEAKPFKRWVTHEVLPSIRRTGSYVPATVDTAVLTFQRAQALDMATSVADRICNRFPKLGEEAQQVIFAKIVNPIAGDEVIPLPRLESKTYTATEVGQLLGISANKVGRLSKAHNLKTSEFGVFVLDKSASSVKQVESFRYNQAGVDRLREVMAPAAGNDLLGGAK